MGNKKSTTILGLLFLTLVVSQVSAATCSCTFDTAKYTAIAEGEGYCSAITKGGKHCTVIFNGNIKPTAKVKPSSVYGSFDKYLSHLRAINLELKATPAVALMRKSDWTTKNLPLMIRSGYAAAPFIEHKEREILDVTLKTLFKKYEKQISASVIGMYSPIWKKDFNVEKGKFEFNVEDISVRFAIFAQP